MRLDELPGLLNVTLGGHRVGTLARNVQGLVVFQYDREWLNEGFSINPYSLPLTDEVFVPDWEPFGGLFGVFNDSLPDGWGALLLDRKLRSMGVDPYAIDGLSRLAIVGVSGRGALCYEPAVDFPSPSSSYDLDELASWCLDILADKPTDDLDAVFATAGSSGGARPKAYIEDDGGEWLVKFPSSMDPTGIGRLEYDYMAAAQVCGIEVPEFKLFPSRLTDGYFATKRFDRTPERVRRHMVTASGIVEVSHRVPALDYESLFQISSFLGGGRSEARRLFRLMCFNVYAHNQDDHSNNFTWICDGGAWRLSPAYDLTYSRSFGGAHATSVLGEGNPTTEHLLLMAQKVGIPFAWAKRTAEEIREVCEELLAKHGLST